MTRGPEGPKTNRDWIGEELDEIDRLTEEISAKRKTARTPAEIEHIEKELLELGRRQDAVGEQIDKALGFVAPQHLN